MQTHIVEVINMPREVAWLPWAVQYFFLIGLSVGAFLLSPARPRLRSIEVAQRLPPSAAGRPGLRTHRACGAAFRPAPTGALLPLLPIHERHILDGLGFVLHPPVSRRPDAVRMARDET